MGASSEHLRQIHAGPQGMAHHIESNKGISAPMGEAKGAKDVPHSPGGGARERGNRAEGVRANIAPSMDEACNLTK